jgi:GNAT superfamily N-acetyltransferase
MDIRLTLQAASDDDAGDLAALRVRAMRPSLEQLGRFDPDRARARFLETFCAACTRHIVQGDTRVGVLVLRPAEDALLLDHLYIAPEHQGRRLGARTLGIVFTEADAQGLPVRVGALKESRSNQFYLRHGFFLVGQSQWDNYYVRAGTTAL